MTYFTMIPPIRCYECIWYKVIDACGYCVYADLVLRNYKAGCAFGETYKDQKEVTRYEDKSVH